jgi:hypothetical protein
MEETTLVGIYLILMVISIPLALGIMVCCIMRYEKKLAQEGEENRIVQGQDGSHWVLQKRWIRVSIPSAKELPVHASGEAEEMLPVN